MRVENRSAGAQRVARGLQTLIENLSILARTYVWVGCQHVFYVVTAGMTLLYGLTQPRYWHSLHRRTVRYVETPSNLNVGKLSGSRHARMRLVSTCAFFALPFICVFGKTFRRFLLDVSICVCHFQQELICVCLYTMSSFFDYVFFFVILLCFHWFRACVEEYYCL